ncbi:alkaline phosphatase [candidate division WOR-3 bacterium]|nr:alkaline phosphatase [candidate division WOR-3 bacterium]
MNKPVKNAIKIGSVVILILIFVFLAINKPWQKGYFCSLSDNYPVKNVIMMVPDGCSNSIQTLARWKKGDALILDSILVGAVKTYMANSVITGSGAAVTAFATGYKTTGGFLSVGPRAEDVLTTFEHPGPEMEYHPLATVLEGAKLQGKSTGLVATSNISHATPAGFACHVDNRNNYNEIMEQMVYENIDVAFGGGKSYLLPKSQGGKRTDGENLLKVLLDRGYQFVETEEEMSKVVSGKVWGLFAEHHMSADIDRPHFSPNQPSLAEMAAKAIELLSQDKDGFFLMVEGSQIDWAGHANDPIYMVTDFLAFDEAVKVAVDFARNDKKTLVLAFPDHNCGALSIGHGNTKKPCSETRVEDLISPLKGMKITAGALEYQQIGTDLSYTNVSKQIKKWWEINITREDYKEIKELMDKGFPLSYSISEVISKNYTVLGWTSHSHTGEDVPLWAYGPNRPVGLYDNTELAEITASALGFNLKEINHELFVDVGEIFSDYCLDKTDTANPVLEINEVNLPINKNLLIAEDKTYELKGIVVYAPKTGKVNIPREAIRIIEELSK